MSTRPPRVRTGDCVGLLSLSGPLAGRCPRRLARSAAELRRRGLRVIHDPTTGFDTGASAGSVAQRAGALTPTIAGSGLLDGAAALVTGRFRQVLAGEWDPWAARDLLAPLAEGPFVGDVEFGHTDPVVTLPIGEDAEVVAGEAGVRIVVRTAGTR